MKIILLDYMGVSECDRINSTNYAILPKQQFFPLKQIPDFL
ncbi:hypothetical protein FDUTEX481_01404 [Tolypothrix sp. PCC 7601]|nr:hypothetical protein FDUTEX481_01404 [Tolypothrix sp. PCC 7601]